MRRVSTWPAGVEAPVKVRVYWRVDHWLLQWWEPSLRKNVSERVEGDLIDAVAKARELDRRLRDLRKSGHGAGHRHLRHRELIERFEADLARRCDAGEIQPASINRYRAALAHYAAYVMKPQIERKHPFAAGVERAFAQGLAAFLAAREVAPNGRSARTRRPMRSHAFVWETVRTVYRWAADPDRGALMPAGFRSPFNRKGLSSPPARDLFGEPDITVAMAVRFSAACDAYQLRLFAPLLFCGLRAKEPAYLFHEYVDGPITDPWLRVKCNSELHYRTKGNRDKRVPLLDAIRRLLASDGRTHGLLYVRRGVYGAGVRARPLLGASMTDVAAEIACRLKLRAVSSAAMRQTIRDQVLGEAGGINYDCIENEFSGLAASLGWPKAATLKDFRHLFLTMLSNAGLAEPYRQYLAGQAQSVAAVTNYTHLDQVRRQYVRAVEQEWPALFAVLNTRLVETQMARTGITL
jgi:hypothetical protein